MTRYLTLIQFTDQGIRNVQQSIHRAGEFRAQVEAAGGKILSMYWSTGEADGCIVFEAPDEVTGASLLLSLGKKGNVRTRTMRVFDAEEFGRIVDGT